MLTQRKAAQQWGVSRVTLQRRIRDGKLSLTADKTIDPAEMTRVFGEPKSGQSRPEYATAMLARIEALAVENATLRGALTGAKDLLAEKDARIADLRQALQLGHDKPTGNRRWWPWGKA